MRDSKGVETKLHIIEGQEDKVPGGLLEVDAKFFDLDSLIRMYGKDRVRQYLGKSMPRDSVEKLLEAR